MNITTRCWNDLFGSVPKALSLDPTMIVISADNPGKERATDKQNSTRYSSTGTEVCDQLTDTSGCCARVVYPNLHEQKTHKLARTMTANWTENKSTSFQLADNLCEAPFHKSTREKHRSRKIPCHANGTLNIHLESITEDPWSV